MLLDKRMQGPWHNPDLCCVRPQTMPDSSDDLQALLSTSMPYGKYKGRLLADLPGHYLNWFAREGFPSGRLGQLLALAHELDHNGLRDLLAPLRGKRS